MKQKSPKKRSRPESPFGPGWTYQGCSMASIDGVQMQHQTWKNKKTGAVRSHRL